MSITVPDPDHSAREERLLLIGTSTRHHLLVRGHTEREDTIRIINARKATRTERKTYEESN